MQKSRIHMGKTGRAYGHTKRANDMYMRMLSTMGTMIHDASASSCVWVMLLMLVCSHVVHILSDGFRHRWEIEDRPSQIYAHFSKNGVVRLQFVATLQQCYSIEHVAKTKNLEAAIQYVTVGQKIGAGLWCMALKRGLHLQKHVAKLVLHVRRDAGRASSTESCGYLSNVIVGLS